MKEKSSTQRLLYSRAETAERLCLSVSSIDVLIARGLLAVHKMGRRVLIPHSSIVAFSQKNVTRIWPEKVGGKSTRHTENSGRNSLRRSASC